MRIPGDLIRRNCSRWRAQGTHERSSRRFVGLWLSLDRYDGACPVNVFHILFGSPFFRPVSIGRRKPPAPNIFRSRRVTHVATTSLLLAAAMVIGGCAQRIRASQPTDATGTPEAAVDARPSSSDAQRDGRDVARFVVKVRGENQSDRVVTELRRLFGSGAEMTPLFDRVDSTNDPDGMARMFKIAIPVRALPSNQPWQNAYHVESALDLEEAEPDFEITLAHSLETGQLCEVEEPPPTDKQWSLKDIRAPQAWALNPPPAGRRHGEGITVCHPDTGWSEHVDLDTARLDLVRARNLRHTRRPGPAGLSRSAAAPRTWDADRQCDRQRP